MAAAESGFSTGSLGLTIAPTMLAALEQEMYAAVPGRELYHYTGYPALLEIVRTGELWATDVHYFNDSSELRHAVEIFTAELRAIGESGAYPPDLIDQLRGWLDLRVADGHMLFVVCVSEAGNLLSQWRGYTPHGNGVSLGFDPTFLVTRATAQDFRLGQCIYEDKRQREIANRAVSALLAHPHKLGPAPPSQAHPSQSYHPAFQQQEVLLLGIAALLKNPAFAAEAEWRAVSTVTPSYVVNPARYRAGRTTLIPYKPLKLRLDPANPMQLAHVYLGPTPENNLAMGALSKFLAASHVSPKLGVRASMLPYRET